MTPNELAALRTEFALIGHDLAALEQRAATVTSATAEQLLRDVLPIFGRTSAIQNPYIDLRPRLPGEEPRLVPEGFEDVYGPSNDFHRRAEGVVDRCHRALGWRR